MIFCSNCGAGMTDDMMFCAECGHKREKMEPGQVLAIPVENVLAAEHPPQQTPRPKQVNQTGKEIQHFLKVSLPALTQKILYDPLEGTKKMLREIKEPAKIGVYSVLVCSVIITMLIYLRIPSEVRQGINFFEFFMKILALPVMGALIITVFSFITKSINNSGSANFSDEILTGGIVSIGYAIFFMVAFLLSYFLESGIRNSGLNILGNLSSGPPGFFLIFIVSLFIYLIIMISNFLSQSLRSSGIKDGAAFYLSPILVISSAYLTIRLWIALFGGNNSSGINGIF